MNDLDPTTRSIAELITDHAASVRLPSGSLAAVRRRAGRRRAHLRLAAGTTGVALLGGTVGVVQAWPGRSPQRVMPADTTFSSEPTPSISTTLVSVTNAVATLDVPLAKGSQGDAVRDLQQALAAVGFDPGPADGQFGTSTQQAVWAFEALVLGRQYGQQTGVVDDALWQALHQPIALQPRRANGAGEAHMEIYLDLQVGIVFTNDAPVMITHISSGTGKTWCGQVTVDIDENGAPLPERVQKNVCSVARTPGGVFEFSRRYEGNRQGLLGGMYNPVYFNYGLAVYGSQNVPAVPSSHGGVRIPMHIAEYFPTLVGSGDQVYVWDGVKEPEQQSKEDMVPSFSYPNPESATTTQG